MSEILIPILYTIFWVLNKVMIGLMKIRVRGAQAYPFFNLILEYSCCDASLQQKRSSRMDGIDNHYSDLCYTYQNAASVPDIFTFFFSNPLSFSSLLDSKQFSHISPFLFKTENSSFF